MLYLVLITYDIADPKRLRRVAKLLENCGERVQKSIFECGLSPDALSSLKHRLERCIDPLEDSILIHPICSQCRGDILWQGKAPDIANNAFWII